MSTPEPPTGPPSEAGSGSPAVEPGHRARALAASLLGELTGQRRSGGLAFSPLEPTGLASGPQGDRGEQESPADPSAPEPAAAEQPAGGSGVPSVAPVAASPAGQPSRPGSSAGQQPTTPSAASATGTAGAPAPAAAPSSAEATTPAAPRPAAQADPATTTPGTPASPAGSGPSASAPATERPAPAAASAPSAGTSLTPAAGTRVPVRTEGSSGSSQDVRPAPFAYLSVAQHHTTPARATAHGALDQAGQRISSRVDRALVRRAAQVTMEAASLLDACDVLDARARAADATWTGEHHSPTEVREFEGAWGAFYDAQGALAQHVSGGA